MKPVFAALCCLLPCAPLHALGAPSLEFTGIEKLDLRIAAGDVRVTGVDSELSTLKVKKKRYDERCRLLVEKRSQTLFVELKPKGLYQAKCEADFDFRLPKNVSLQVKSAEGNVQVNGMDQVFETSRKPLAK